MKKKSAQILVIALSIVAVAWTVSRTDLPDLLEILGQISPTQVLFLLALNGVIFILFALRWWIFVRASGAQVSLAKLIRFRLTSFGITYFTPGPQFGGEPYQVYALSKNCGLSHEKAVSSVSMDKLVELATNFSFLVVGLSVALLAGYLPAGADLMLIPAMALLLSLPVLYLVFARYGKKPISTILGMLARLRPGVAKDPPSDPSGRFEAWMNQSAKFTEGAYIAAQAVEANLQAILRERPAAFFAGLALAALTWLLVVGEYYLALDFLGIPLTLVQAVVVLTAARLAFMLPAPSGLGTFEASQVIAMPRASSRNRNQFVDSGERYPVWRDRLAAGW